MRASPRHRRRHRRLGRIAAVAAVATALAAGGAAVASLGGGSHAAAPGTRRPAPSQTAAVQGASAPAATHAGRPRRRRADPGRLPQTPVLPSSTTPAFRARMRALWAGVVTGRPRRAMAAFFPLAAYEQVKAIADPAADYRSRLVSAYRLDLLAAHRLVGAGRSRFLRVVVPHQWEWIPPGACFNGIGYWHAPGSRLVYERHGVVRSFGVFSLISWRGEWYVVHLSSYTDPGTVDQPAVGQGGFGPPGGC